MSDKPRIGRPKGDGTYKTIGVYGTNAEIDAVLELTPRERMEAMLAKLAWKQELPTTPGWYWLKEPREDARIVHVRDYAGKLAIGNVAINGWSAMEKSLWAGPIKEPMPAQDKE